MFPKRISAAELPAAPALVDDTGAAAHGLRAWGGKVAAMVDGAAQKASDTAHDGVAWVRDGAHDVQLRADRALRDSRHYLQDRPFQSVLVAALVGGAIVAVALSLSKRRR